MNDRVALAEAEKKMRARINDQHMRNGVTMIDPTILILMLMLTIGQDSVILPGTMLKGKTNNW